MRNNFKVRFYQTLCNLESQTYNATSQWWNQLIIEVAFVVWYIITI